ATPTWYPLSLHDALPISTARRLYGSPMAPRSLTDVIATLDAEVLHVVQPGAAAAEVRDVVILDPSDPGSVGPGTIVLAIGMADRDRKSTRLNSSHLGISD